MCAEDAGDLVCIACPRSCLLRVDPKDPSAVLGAGCERGLEYIESETTSAGRVFTGIVRVEGGARPVAPVRSTTTVPRAELLGVARRLATVSVAAPVAFGDIVFTDPCLGIEFRATGDAPAAAGVNEGRSA